MIGFTYNEESRRYIDNDPEFFVPEIWRSRPEGSVKQGSGTKEITEIIGEDHLAMDFTIDIKEGYDWIITQSLDLYKRMIRSGVAPEQARMVLPQSMYVEYYVTGSLAAFARAYKQRSDPHAQLEIQELAKEWDRLIRPLFPVSWSCLVDKI